MEKSFVYSILPFVVFRCLEQIRNNVLHNDLDVNIIGADRLNYILKMSHNTSGTFWF